MNKKMIIIILVVLLTAGGVVGFWVKSKDADKDIKELEGKIDTSDTWNPYADEYNYLHTLSDFILSSGGGSYITKMTVTLEFSGEENYHKFKGFKDQKSAEGAEEGGHGGDAHITPMEYKINDIIGELMLEADETKLLDKDKLKDYLLTEINKEIGFEEPLLKGVFIENYVIQ